MREAKEIADYEWKAHMTHVKVHSQKTSTSYLIQNSSH